MRATTIDRIIIVIFLIALIITNTIQSYTIISSIERNTRSEICAIREILIHKSPEFGSTNGTLKACDSE